MKLTRRQQMFLGKFLDLYRRAEGPLHYTTVAEYLGISPITTYDMLRLLEDRGLVTSDYIPPSQREGTGRSIVVFLPTPTAQALFDELSGGAWDREEWEEVKTRTLQSLREGKGTDYHDLLEDLLARIPDRRSPMLYVTEMITAVILSLYQLGAPPLQKKEEAADSSLSEKLRALGLPGELGPNALVGLAVGLSYVERANRRITSFLLSQLGRYQETLNRLSSENRRRLADFVSEVVEIAGK